MEHDDLASSLKEFRRVIPVNGALKNNLRDELAAARKPSVISKAGMFRRALALCAALAMALLFVVPRLGGHTAISAASLQVNNHISFLDLGSGQAMGVSVHNDVLYVPIFGQGVIACGDDGFISIYDHEVGWVRVSPDGARLAVSSSGTVSILDIESGQVAAVLEGDDTTYYEEPSWSGDGKKLIYTRKVLEFLDHGFTVKESKICEIRLDTLEARSLVTGSYASYIPGSPSIVYQDGGEIVIRNLKDGSETLVGPGRFPCVDPQGHLIAYVKEDTSFRQLTDYAAVQEVLANIWIADVKNPATCKKVTSNFLHEHIDEETWLSSLNPSGAPQVLVFGGAYSYYNPVWSSDSESIFVLKSPVSEAEWPSNMRLTRVDLSQDDFSPKDLVDRFIQALIKRDEDYARSLMKEPGDCSLTMSNPRQVGYTVLSAGTEEGKTYVDAEVYWQYTALPYYEAVKSRFYLCDADGVLLIDRVTQMSRLEAYEKEGTVYLDDGDNETVVLEKGRIASQFPPGSQYRLPSLTYVQDRGMLVTAIQVTVPGEEAAVWVATYDIEADRFQLVTKIGEGKANSGVSKLTVDSRGRYVAADLFSQGPDGVESTVYLCDLSNGKVINILELFSGDMGDSSATASFWSDRGLLLEVHDSGQSMTYMHVPGEESPVRILF